MNFWIKAIVIFSISSCQFINNDIFYNNSHAFKLSSNLIIQEGKSIEEFVLIEKNNSIGIWESKDFNKVLVTLNGKIIEKHSNENDFAVRIKEADIENFYTDNYSYQSSIEYYFPNSGTLDAKAKISFIGVDAMDSNTNQEFKLYKEVITIKTIRKTLINFYWINDNGDVIKSIQTINPLSGPVTIFYK